MASHFFFFLEKTEKRIRTVYCCIIMCVVCFNNNNKDPVSCLYFDAPESYLFTGSFDCNVCIWQVGAPGREAKVSRAVGWLKNGPKHKVRSIVFCPRSRQVNIIIKYCDLRLNCKVWKIIFTNWQSTHT